MHRRTAIRALAVGWGTTAFMPNVVRGAPSSSPSPAAPAHNSATHDRLWDVHTHLTQAWYGESRGPLTATQLLRWMDAHGVAKACVLPLVSPEAFWYPISTDDVLQQTAPHRDRLIPFCAIDPRTLETHLTDPKEVVGMLKRFQDAGARGFGEHKPRLAIDAPASMRLYDACADVRLPVLFHLDNAANIDAPGLPGVSRVLAEYPELILIGHGKGWWASIAGGLQQSDLHVGYPPGPVAPHGALDRLLRQHANLYADLSSSGAHALLRDIPHGKQFLERHASRLLFGTDYYDLQQKDFAQFEMFDRLEASAVVREKVGYTNAQQLFG